MSELITHLSPHQLTQVVNITHRHIGGPVRSRFSGGPIRSLRDRQTDAFASVYGISGSADILHHRPIRHGATLTPHQLWTVYQMCGDVRAAVDSIGRRVSTQNWRMTPSVTPDDPRYPRAVEQCEAVTMALQCPNDEDDWRTFVLKVTTDALVFWHGAIELAYAGSASSRGWIEEFGTPHGPTIHPQVGRDGRWFGYVQDMPGSGGYFGAADDRNGVTRLRLDQIALLRLTPNTRTPYPVPIIETIVREVTTLVRASERTMHTMDRHEIPTGFLILSGMPAKAEDEVGDALTSKAGRDDKIRILHTMGGQTPAQWLRVQETFKEVEYRDVVSDTRNVVYRNFGVNRIEMGETEGATRTSSQAQLDVGNSHLIEPLLEAWSSLVNKHIIGPLVQRFERNRRAETLCEYVYADDEHLTPEQEKIRAEAVEIRLRSGQTTLNEERKSSGRDPVDGGDVVRVVGEEIGAPRPDGDPTADPDNDGGSDGGDGDGSQIDEMAGCGPECGHGLGGGVEAVLGALAVEVVASIRTRRDHDLLPSDWQSPGRFTGFRTIDLTALFDEVVGYAKTVDPLWATARSEVVAATASAFRAGALDSRYRNQLDEILAKLKTSWSLATLGHYLQTAEIGADSARQIANYSALGSGAEAQGRMYHNNAMAYLDALISDLKIRVLASVDAIRSIQVRQEPGDGVGPDSEQHDLLMAVEGAFDANEHRITNWSGRLVELGSTVMALALIEHRGQSDDMPAGDFVISDEPGEAGGGDQAAAGGEWYGLWVSLLDAATCADCEDQAAEGVHELSTFTTWPGGDVICRGNCRCVVVWFTREEVDKGLAEVP